MSSNNNRASVAKITWELDNFNHCSKFHVKKFVMPTNRQAKFQLSCFPNKEFPSFGNNYTFIYLYLEDCDKAKPIFRYRTSILNANGDKCKTQEGEVAYVTSRLQHEGIFQIFREYLLDPANKLLVEDLTNENNTDRIRVQIQHKDFLSNKLAKDYQSLLESGKFSDASLIEAIGEKRFLVHKVILSARYKVFAAMFENDCEEKRKNRVEITDISAEVCEQMLSYIYTGQIPDMKKYAADLFVVADKYELDHLKAICEQHLSAKLEVDTAANTLLVADMHHASVLKASSIEFIMNHGKKVIASEGWKVLIKARPDLGCQLFEQIYKEN